MPSSNECTGPRGEAPSAPGRINRFPIATNGRAIQSARRRDSNVSANAANRTSATTRPYWFTRTAHAPPTAARVAIPAKVAAIPASMGNPFVRNLCSERANTKGSTGSMHGLNMVSTPPKNTKRTTVMCCTLSYP